MIFGSYGPVVFRVSDDLIRTIDGLTQSVGSEWATHSRIGLKDKPEYLRPSLRKLTFNIKLVAPLGVRPRAELDKLEYIAEYGLVYPFILGIRRVGRNRWRMTAVEESWETIYIGGQLAKADAKITLEEYV